MASTARRSARRVYACHPTAVGGGVHGWLSPDFVGPARDRIEGETGAPMVFLQGCGGNCGTGKWIAGTPPRTSWRWAAGSRDGIASALAGATPVDLVRFEVGGASRRRAARSGGVGTVADLEAELAEVAAAARAGHLEGPRDRRPRSSSWSRSRRAGSRASWPPALGDLALVSLPGEQFVQHGLRSAPSSPIAETIVTAYDDNSLQYVPDRGGLPRGLVRGRRRLALRRAGRRRGDPERGAGPAPDLAADQLMAV